MGRSPCATDIWKQYSVTFLIRKSIIRRHLSKKNITHFYMKMVSRTTKNIYSIGWNEGKQKIDLEIQFILEA